MVTIIQGDCRDVLKTLPAASVNCCVTSPPYWGLRDYGVAGQLGLERTPDEYVAHIVAVFREVWRVLRDEGTCWLNLGDSWASGKGSCFNPGGGESSFKDFRKEAGVIPLKRLNVSEVHSIGLKPKDLVGIPWRVAFALQADGWYLRSDIIWHKKNPMPESVTDRPTKSHEYIFLLAKSERYYYDAAAIMEPAICGDGGGKFTDERDAACRGRIGQGPRRKTVARGEFNGKTNALPGREAFRSIKDTRNKRDVWTVATTPYSGAHFATFPEELILPCILAGCPAGGTILDPFGGSGTTGAVAAGNGRNAILIELNPEYVKLAQDRCGLFCSTNSNTQPQEAQR